MYAIRMTATAQSIKKLAESVEFISKNFGVKNIQVEPVFQVGRALSNKVSEVDPQIFVEEFRKARQVALSYGKSLKYSGARFHVFTNHFCTATSNSIVITPDGLVTSCYEIVEPEDPRASLFIYGKVDLEANKLVFDYDKINKLRLLSVENKVYCKNCFCKWHCAGDCAAKLAVQGDPLNPSKNSRCYINQELTKDQIKDYLYHSLYQNIEREKQVIR